MIQMIAGVWMFAYWMSNMLWDLLFFHFPVFFIIMLFYAFDYQIFVVMGLEVL